MRTVTPWAGMNCKNFAHLCFLRTRIKRLVARSLKRVTASIQMSKNQSG